jgi:isochorismate hydrolase
MIRPIEYSRQKYIVVDIDTQRCFFSGSGKACVNDSETVLANIRRVIAWTRLKHIYVVSTKQVPVCCYDFQRGNTKGLEKIGSVLICQMRF